MTELTPEAFVNAVLAIIADPDAAKKSAKERAAIKTAHDELEAAKNSQNARELELGKRDRRLQTVAAEQELERQRLAAGEQSLAERAAKLTAGENKLQADIVAHGQANNRQSAELNSREQKVAKDERELVDKLRLLEADRAEVAKRLKAARAFVDAA
jgi:hypothetical protein